MRSSGGGWPVERVVLRPVVPLVVVPEVLVLLLLLFGGEEEEGGGLGAYWSATAEAGGGGLGSVGSRCPFVRSRSMLGSLPNMLVSLGPAPLVVAVEVVVPFSVGGLRCSKRSRERRRLASGPPEILSVPMVSSLMSSILPVALLAWVLSVEATKAVLSSAAQISE